jgi:hypothetical protein
MASIKRHQHAGAKQARARTTALVALMPSPLPVPAQWRSSADFKVSSSRTVKVMMQVKNPKNLSA